MPMKSVFLAGVAALALVGCGGEGGDAGASTSRAASKAASPKAASPIDAKFSLKDAAPLDVDALFALMPGASRPTYASADFDDKLGATVLTDLQFTDPSDGGGVTIDRVELFGVDPDAMSRVNAATDASVDAPFETIFEKVRLYGVQPNGEGDDAIINFGAVEIDKLQLRQGGYDDTQDNPALLFNAFDLGGLYFKDISVDATEEEGPKVQAALPDVRIVGVSGGKVGAIVINDMNYEIVQTEETMQAMTGLLGEQGALLMNSPLRSFIAPGNQKASVKSFVWNGFDLSGLMAFSLKGEEPPYTAKNLVRLGSMELRDVETYINGELAYKTEKSTVTATESTWLIPTKVRAKSEGDTYNFTAYVPEGEEELLQIVKDNGLDKIKGSSDMSWDWDSAKGGAAFKTNMDMSGFANLAMGFDLDGLEIEKLAEAIGEGDEAAVASIGQFNGFNLTLKDGKLLDTIFDIAALQMGGTGDDLRQSAPAMVRLSGAQAAALNPRIQGYVDAFAAFLSDGGTLEISANPDQAVPFADIAAAGETGPQTLPDVLDLTVTHKK
ncbi:MAG: hypothetical protein AAGJ73_07965 [Pseudomonadota bacterium]